MSWLEAAATPATPAALTGLRVLDLTQSWGAYATKLLADMGADVVQVEPPGGNPAREVGPFARDDAHPDRSLHFWHFHTSKRSVTLDLAQPPGRARMLALAASAQLVVEDRAPGDLDRLGVGYDALRRANPAIVLTSITPFGQSGPYSGYRGTDLVALAMGGLLGITGGPDAPPVRPYGDQSHHVASLYGALGSLAALRVVAAGGTGQHVDVSAQAAVATCSRLSALYIAQGEVPRRRGVVDFFAYPSDVFPCRDGEVLILATSAEQWERLVAWLDEEGMAGPLVAERFAAAPYRREHLPEVRALLSAWTRTHAVAEVFAGGQARRLPIGAVAGVPEFATNPHLRARGFFVPVTHDDTDEQLTYPGAPYLFSRTPWRIRRAPRLGEHDVALPPAADSGAAESAREVTAAVAQDERPRPTATPLAAPLAGVRIADFTWAWAGPFATKVLADLGAEVIRIERPDARARAQGSSLSSGPAANALNRNKLSITVDWKDPRGMALIRDLVSRSDVVIDNFSAGTMERAGLGYEQLRALRPDVIALSLSGFGQTGPWARYVSLGPTLQALSGLIHLTGYPDRPGVGVGEAYPDVQGGLHGALATLIALAERDRTGEGQFVDIGQFQTAGAVLGTAALEYFVNGRARAREGNVLRHPPAAPHGVYPCAGEDRWCAIAVTSDEEWAALRQALGEPAWSTDTRFASVAGRYEHRDAIDAPLAAWTRDRSAEAVMHALQQAGVPAGVVQDTRDLVDHDPQLHERRFWEHTFDGQPGASRFEGSPVHYSRTPVRFVRPAPLPGDDRERVLGGLLGLSPETIAEYVAAGVI